MQQNHYNNQILAGWDEGKLKLFNAVLEICTVYVHAQMDVLVTITAALDDTIYSRRRERKPPKRFIWMVGWIYVSLTLWLNERMNIHPPTELQGKRHINPLLKIINVVRNKVMIWDNKGRHLWTSLVGQWLRVMFCFVVETMMWTNGRSWGRTEDRRTWEIRMEMSNCCNLL